MTHQEPLLNSSRRSDGYYLEPVPLSTVDDPNNGPKLPARMKYSKVCSEKAQKLKLHSQVQRQQYRFRGGHIVDSLWLYIFMFLVITVDFVFCFWYKKNELYVYTTLAITCLYWLEIILRIYAYTFFIYFDNFFDAIDFILILTSMVLWSLFLLDADIFLHMEQYHEMFRFIRVLYKFILAFARLPTVLRSLVRMNKQGIKLGRFTLDLCYITDSILAMGLPALGVESCYRNSILDVRKYLDMTHEGHYLIIDLCEERDYPPDFFHGRVLRRPFKDHSVPTLGSLIHICKCSLDFLRKDEKNVVVVHCKGGKGRTGLVIVALMSVLYDDDVDKLLAHFAKMRTDQVLKPDHYPKQEIANGSQIRFVKYVHKLVHGSYGFPTITSCPKYLESCDGLYITAFTWGPLPQGWYNNDFEIQVQVIKDVDVKKPAPIFLFGRDDQKNTRNENMKFINISINEPFHCAGNIFISLWNNRSKFASICVHTYHEVPQEANGIKYLKFQRKHMDAVNKFIPQDFELTLKIGDGPEDENKI